MQYDIASGTEARFVREYRLPAADGFAASGGGVTALENGNWLITWGTNGGTLAVSEVDTRGNEIFRMHMAADGRTIHHRAGIPRTGRAPSQSR